MHYISICTLLPKSSRYYSGIVSSGSLHHCLHTRPGHYAGTAAEHPPYSCSGGSSSVPRYINITAVVVFWYALYVVRSASKTTRCHSYELHMPAIEPLLRRPALWHKQREFHAHNNTILYRYNITLPPPTMDAALLLYSRQHVIINNLPMARRRKGDENTNTKKTKNKRQKNGVQSRGWLLFIASLCTAAQGEIAPHAEGGRLKQRGGRPT